MTSIGEEMAGFCGGCGQPLADDARFCVTCGKPTMPETGTANPPFDPNAAPAGYAPGAPSPVYGAVPMPGAPYAIPPAGALPPRPAMSRKTVFIMVAVVAVIGLGYLGWTTIPPLLTSPGSVADQFVRAAESGSDTAVAPLVASELGASTASDALNMLGDASFTPAFKVESQQGLSAIVTTRSDRWDYRLTVARVWNGPWRISRIELTRSEVQTESVPAPTSPEYVDWELWPSSEYEVNLSDAKDGERTFTTIHTMVNGESDQVEGSSTVTAQAVAAKTLRGTGPALDTYGSAYSANQPSLNNGEELSLSMAVTIASPYGGAAAPKGAKLQAHIRTPDGAVVDSEVITNSGKADASSYYTMTATWNWTPGLMKEKGDPSHPANNWLPGTYAIVYTANDEVVGANYWQPSE